jgi:hypothetical protein
MALLWKLLDPVPNRVTERHAASSSFENDDLPAVQSFRPSVPSTPQLCNVRLRGNGGGRGVLDRSIVIPPSVLEPNARSSELGALAALVLAVGYAATMCATRVVRLGTSSRSSRFRSVSVIRGDNTLYVWLSGCSAGCRSSSAHGTIFLSAFSGALCALLRTRLRRTVPVSGPTRSRASRRGMRRADLVIKATVIELYATASFSFSDHRARDPSRRASVGSRDRGLVLGFLGGLLATVNPCLRSPRVSLHRRHATKLRPALLRSSEGGVMLGLLPYVHVLFRSHAHRLVWGELVTWMGFHAYLLGRRLRATRRPRRTGRGKRGLPLSTSLRSWLHGR